MKRLPFLVLALLALASCHSRGNRFVPYEFGELQAGFSPRVETGYHRALGVESIPHKDGALSSVYSSLYNDGSRFAIPSIGKQKLLVIPVDFDASPGDKDQISTISSAFFGQCEDSEFPSVAEYYDLSSYHRLHIQGKVAESFHRCSYSLAELSAITGARKSKAALSRIYSEAIRWYDETYPEDPSSNYAFEDGKGNRVVPVYLIYNAPYYGEGDNASNRESMMWAFTINDPAPVSWSSYSMLFSNGRIDSHTCIHEAGHLLGIPDYYDVSGLASNQYSPLGRADMMDCSLGDHNPFTKYVLGWVKPFVADASCKVTLRPFADTGECLLLGGSGDTPYDEYLLLSYYTPGSLNYVDAFLRNDPSMKMMSSSGILAYKVDARLGLFPKGISSPIGHFTSESDLNEKSIGFFSNNSYGKVAEDGYSSSALVHILCSDLSSDRIPFFFVASDEAKTVVTEEGELHCRDVVFDVGQGIGNEDFPSLSFPSGKALASTFTVKKINPTYAEIVVKK